MSKIALNGATFSWNDYLKHGADELGITSPEREFDKMWNKLVDEMIISHVGAVTPEFLAALPEVPEDHPFNKDREKFLSDRLMSTEEWNAKDRDGPEMYWAEEAWGSNLGK